MERWEKIKAHAVGAIGGIILAPVVAFSADWVVTTGTMSENMETARIEQLATVCAIRAKQSWNQESPPDLYGWDKRDAREKVAREYAVVMPEEESAEEDVIEECADKIEDMVKA
jgi:hypothetical protein